MSKKIYGLNLCRNADDNKEVIPIAEKCHKNEITEENFAKELQKGDEFIQKGQNCKGNLTNI